MQLQSLQAGERCANTKVQLNASSNSVGLTFVKIDGVMRRLDDMGSLGIAESCPFHSNSAVAFESLSLDLRANVLAFSITIRPDEKNTSILSLLLDVLGDPFFVLINADLGRSLEQLAGLT